MHNTSKTTKTKNARDYNSKTYTFTCFGTTDMDPESSNQRNSTHCVRAPVIKIKKQIAKDSEEERVKYPNHKNSKQKMITIIIIMMKKNKVNRQTWTIHGLQLLKVNLN